MVELFGQKAGRILLIILVGLMMTNSVLDFIRWRDDVNVQHIVADHQQTIEEQAKRLEMQREMLDARAQIQIINFRAGKENRKLTDGEIETVKRLWNVAQYDRVEQH